MRWINRDLIAKCLTELSDRTTQEKLWMSDGSTDASSFVEAVEQLFTDSGLGNELDAGTTGLGQSFDESIRELRKELQCVNGQSGPEKIINSSAMAEVRRLSQIALSHLDRGCHDLASIPINACTTNALTSLEGARLSSVEFLEDYVQLRFDGPCLTSITPPRVHVSNVVLDWGIRDYRNALCERIGKRVLKASDAQDQEIRIEFDDGTSIVISLKPADYRAAEAAILTAATYPTTVW